MLHYLIDFIQLNYMTLLTWTQDNSVGVEELDGQHQKLFSIINNLYDLMRESKTEKELQKVLQELIDYAKYHFNTEEKYFDEYKYPNKDVHISYHRAYEEKVNNFMIESKKGLEVIISYDVLDFLEDWWLKHINIEDKKYSTFFHEHGLK